ncbi:MAG: hypothetical protein JWM16_3913 [Verrucomicrobiales bacterium]|nr:hypothetical protein [Verrucomicrobiales bacterium]
MLGNNRVISKMKLLASALFSILLAFSTLAAEKPAKSPPVQPPHKLSPWSDFVEPDFPFYSSVLDARKLGKDWPTNNLTPRGIILNLGNGCWACFDTDLLRISAVWRGKGLTPVSMAQGSYHSGGDKAPEGQDKLPQIFGTPWLANGIYPGWQKGSQMDLVDPRTPCPEPNEVGRGPLPRVDGRFSAIRSRPNGLSLEYEVFGTAVTEWIQVQMQENQPVVQRRVVIGPHLDTFWLPLGHRPAAAPPQLHLSVAAPIEDGKPVAEKLEENDFFAVRVAPSTKPVDLQIAIGFSASITPWKQPEATSTKPLPRWPQTVTTRAKLSASKDAFVVDNMALPLNNPWKRNVRIADLAFFKDGRAAAVTFDGDVWLISGLKENLEQVQWKRFASGLHEPLSICVRNEEVFVFDRNGIWLLRDADGNGEADTHELFSNGWAQTAETREYANGMKLAPDGSFIIAKGGQQGSTTGKQNGTILRLSPDGKTVTEIAYGLRQPFLGVNPKTGLITASDQQGHYVPSTPLHIIRDRQFYGFISQLLPKEQYPAPIAEPLTWIPHAINASGASQVWLQDAKMGPLNDALIHLGYYRPEIFAVLLNNRTSRLQAAVLSLTRDLEFAPLNGAINPVDGQLYVTGFQIWGTTANQVAGLARLRYTGGESTFPQEVVPMDRGILLRFSVPLDPARATNPANFSAERWNYKRTANYGSPHFKTDGSKGQDNMVPSSAYLSKDRKSVFVGIPDMRSVMQMRLGWALGTTKGKTFEQSAYFTPYELTLFEPTKEGFAALTVDLTPRTIVASANTPVTSDEGKKTAELMGCVACHSADGSTLGKVGPSWRGLFGRERKFSDGTSTVANDAYLQQSIREPAAKVVSGFDKSDTGMPSYEGVLSDAQIQALILYIKSLR